MYFEGHYPIDTRDADPQYHCRPSALLGYLQEAATDAANQLCMTRQELLEQHHGFWMLARIWVELNRPLRWQETLTIRTWHREGRGASVYRDFDLYVDGEPVGQAVSTWVLADVESHRLMRIDKVPGIMGTNQGGELEKNISLGKLKLPDDLEVAERRRMHYSETDMNGHINNTRYADFACDALKMEGMEEGEFVRELQIGFLAECHAGEELVLSAGMEENHGFVRGNGADGKPRFEALLTFGKG